jgi:methylated-DNA-[protein]-cysteine S-methyltransferase
VKQINIKYYKSPVGEMIIGSYGGKLCLADWRYRKDRYTIDNRIQKALCAKYIEESTMEIEETLTQIHEYFSAKREKFDIPLLILGTDFQKSVWKALMEVGYGETLSYLELAKKVGNEKAVRAVAAAVGANAISICIPCHRIIGSDGSLTGYAGGVNVKKKLLDIEGY